jgi:transcriptional regulator with XRE-family HTH domain
MSNQLSLPVPVPVDEVARKRSLGDAIDLCAELAGLTLDKQLAGRMGVDKGQFSRWGNGEEGIKWPKFAALMDFCGNDAPVLWMAHQRGWDLHSFRRLETETERECRRLREENAALRRVLVGVGA